MQKTTLLLLFSAVILGFGCKKDPDFQYYYYTPEEQAVLSQYLNLPENPVTYGKAMPMYLGFTASVFDRPVPDYAKVELGKVLFYDKNLSKDKTISCASCHKQELAFADNAAVSSGVFGRAGERNSIALASVPSFGSAYDATGASLFWDNRAKTVQEQSKASLANVKEMDMSMPEVVSSVNVQPYYGILFKKAYGDPVATEERVTEAIQTFVHTLSSFESKFDQAAEAHFKAGNQNFTFVHDDFGKFSAQENQGKTLYMTHCASCHTEVATIPRLSFASNGLDENPTDEGVGGISNVSAEMGTFKVPSLRNVGLTAPYMHDGRFQTLEQVVEHYSTGVKPHVNLHINLKNANGTPRNLNLNASEKQALIAFLHTFTDNKLAYDERFFNPFK
ncbi:MAG TPA: cytochrome c peroxidase [Saprospiraceae bacterium]|nr:cytochrome c peroxidase [Saprospiraceae bacterium]